MPCRLVLSEHKSAGGEAEKQERVTRASNGSWGTHEGATECFRPRRDMSVGLPAGEQGEGEMMEKGTPGKLLH